MTASATTKAVKEGIHQLEVGSFNLSPCEGLGSKGIFILARWLVRHDRRPIVRIDSDF
jgi:hypothetical protein